MLAREQRDMEFFIALVVSGAAILVGAACASLANPCETYLGFYVAGAALTLSAPAGILTVGVIRYIQTYGGMSTTDSNVNPRRSLETKDGAALAFVGFLVAIAYQNASIPAGSILEGQRVSFADAAMFVGFTLSALGVFLFGAFNLAFSPAKGAEWIVSFLLLTIDGIILTFVGQVVTTGTTRQAKIGFPELVVTLVAVDGLWNLASFWRYKSARQGMRPYTGTAVATAILVVVFALAWKNDSSAQLVLLSAVLVLSFLVQAVLVIRDELV